ncbi:ABC transporter permease [Qiania dongpingensis]|uniref:ABC transporter permease n=1 Tax=Qiania dongpingensis TaxID=2763669 RepID=A0A7G9G1E9_9FIRM|nr:ABC transporter permease [Qiania dongpingensis]QNM04631.1 ABC transporter permease [Qiania dongpingensis]
MLENIRLSFQGIWAHKLRSFLTMLGIIIGIGSIIAIVSTIKGTNEQIKQNLVGAGNNAVKIQLYQGDWPMDLTYTSPPDGVPVITPEVREEILGLSEVIEASLYYTRNEYSAVFNGSQTLTGGNIVGIDNHYLDVYGYQITKGRGFTDKDFTDSRKVVLLDKTASSNLFQGEDPIGKTVEIKGEPFTVIGLIGQKAGFEPVINSLEDYERYASNYSSGLVCVPDAIWPVLYQYGEPQNLVVRAASTDDMTAAGEKASDILNGYLYVSDETIKYKGEDLLEQANKLQELSAATNRQLIWIASISLLVGGIGVMNIMLVSVTERTREIGLKKALGARKTRILGQFLTEAAVLTGLGGILGIGAGIGLAYIISSLSQAPVAISIPAIVVSVVFSTLIGLIFGIIPSFKAANLNPIDALRHE